MKLDKLSNKYLYRNYGINLDSKGEVNRVNEIARYRSDNILKNLSYNQLQDKMYQKSKYHYSKCDYNRVKIDRENDFKMTDSRQYEKYKLFMQEELLNNESKFMSPGLYTKQRNKQLDCEINSKYKKNTQDYINYLKFGQFEKNNSPQSYRSRSTNIELKYEYRYDKVVKGYVDRFKSIQDEKISYMVPEQTLVQNQSILAPNSNLFEFKTQKTNEDIIETKHIKDFVQINRIDTLEEDKLYQTRKKHHNHFVTQNTEAESTKNRTIKVDLFKELRNINFTKTIDNISELNNTTILKQKNVKTLKSPKLTPIKSYIFNSFIK